MNPSQHRKHHVQFYGGENEVIVTLLMSEMSLPSRGMYTFWLLALILLWIVNRSTSRLPFSVNLWRRRWKCNSVDFRCIRMCCVLWQTLTWAVSLLSGKCWRPEAAAGLQPESLQTCGCWGWWWFAQSTPADQTPEIHISRSSSRSRWRCRAPSEDQQIWMSIRFAFAEGNTSCKAAKQQLKIKLQVICSFTDILLLLLITVHKNHHITSKYATKTKPITVQNVNM